MAEPPQPPQTDGEQAAGAVRSWWRRNPTLRNWISGVTSAGAVPSEGRWCREDLP